MQLPELLIWKHVKFENVKLKAHDSGKYFLVADVYTPVIYSAEVKVLVNHVSSSGFATFPRLHFSRLLR